MMVNRGALDAVVRGQVLRESEYSVLTLLLAPANRAVRYCAHARRAAPPRQLLVLAAGASTSQLDAQCLAWQLALSEVVFWPVYMHDIGSDAASGRAALASALRSVLRLQKGGVASKLKKLVYVVIMDYDAEEASREQISAAFIQGMERVFLSALGTAQAARDDALPRLSDRFAFQFSFLPHARFQADAYADALDDLSARFTDPTSDHYVFAASGAARQDKLYESVTPLGELAAHAESIAKALNAGAVPADLAAAGRGEGRAAAPDAKSQPPAGELELAYKIERCFVDTCDQFDSKVQQWRIEVEAGRIIGSFGPQGSSLLKDVLASFEQECKELISVTASSGMSGLAAPPSAAIHALIAGKTDELKNKISLALHAMYTRQLLRLREVAYEVFQQRLQLLQVTERVEKDVRSITRETLQFFTDKATELKVAGISTQWSFDCDKKELMRSMREDGTEKIQAARVQGDFAPPPRQPIAMSFHYLQTAPFGWTDSRYETLTSSGSMRYAGGDDSTLDAVRVRAAAEKDAAAKLPKSGNLVFYEPTPAR
ncbi:Protein SEY1 [Porphyridium purpureum]|uniref:Protein SEY1 n=1 Tax=Porphyridium purpureum TaxID=35688 RepID=A0A5J4YPU5_PORPP|nr:Protein SEY1 [Porphyridium purpureum]|eukprot:POR0331..scf296_7